MKFCHLTLAALLAVSAGRLGAESPPIPPAVVLIAVDTLRADRLTSAGYSRNTSPSIDALLSQGVRLSDARTVEPLTAPAMATSLTGIPPHRHGVTRNGMRLSGDLQSVPSLLREHGWMTAAFVGNWTLRPDICGFDQFFDVYEPVLTRRRWFGLFNRESTAADVSDAALSWIRLQRTERPNQPVFLWVHYVEPHAPYRHHEQFDERLGLGRNGRNPSKSDRYDTEVAAVDAEVGRFVEELSGLFPAPPLIIFLSDHGESLGERGEWGHGRSLFEPGLRIPVGFTWKGVIPPGRLNGPSSILDVAATTVGLLSLERPDGMGGLDHSNALRAGGGEVSSERVLCVQAHRGAVHGEHDADRARSKGLLAVGVVVDDRKEMVRLGKHRVTIYDLKEDPGETRALDINGDRFSDELMACYGEVTEALGRLDKLAVNKLDDESLERLRALGYLE